MTTKVHELPAKQEKDDRRDGEFREDKAKRTASGFQNHLELRLGISLDNGFDTGDVNGGGGGGGGVGCQGPRFLTTQEEHVLSPRNGPGAGGAKRSFSETSGGFVHPWSLAARQEKAALEHAHRKTNPAVTRATNPPPPVVGWPPVRSFRRSLGVSQPSKLAMSEEKVKLVEKENIQEKFQQIRSTMFVKVNMDGYAVGRKIDLKAHDGYDSLSRALQKMFHNFLSANYLNNQKQDEGDELNSPNYILLYEDNEGDRMLVGDVPWELFISSVKRLYITQDPRANKSG